MNIDISDLKLDDICENFEYLMTEYPKILGKSFRSLLDVSHPDISKIELYDMFIRSHAVVIGMPLKEINDFAEDVLKKAEIIALSQSIP